jgi:putative membrane protein
MVDWSEGWIYAKLAFIAMLGAIHGMLSRYRRAFAEDRNVRSARFFRILNEVPAVLMVGIVIFVVVKPF